MRSGGGNRNTITATPRQLESLIRLSQALAKMRLSNEVKSEDVREAARLIRVATQNAATDPRTGTIDLDLLTGGRSSKEKDRLEVVMRILSEILSGNQLKGQTVTLGQLRQIIAKDEAYVASKFFLFFILSFSFPLFLFYPSLSVSFYLFLIFLLFLALTPPINPQEMSQVLRQLAEEGTIQYKERTQTIIVREA